MLEKPYSCPQVLWDYFDDEEKEQVVKFIMSAHIPLEGYEVDVDFGSPFYFIVSESTIGTIIRISHGEASLPIQSFKRTANSVLNINTR